jgi:hypothetical protein
MDPGTSYLTHRVHLRKATDSCGKRRGTFGIRGKTPMGLIGAASEYRGSLQPIRVNDSFGLLVCRIGSYTQTSSPFRGWAYRLNYEFPLLGADQQSINGSDSVLWYYIDYGSNRNIGDALQLSAPVRAVPGSIQVSVTAYPFSGGPGPAPNGTVVSGGDAPAVTNGGDATVLVGHPGIYRLRASDTGNGAVPSQALTVCVNSDLKACAAHRGERIVGRRGSDEIKGTAGPDVVIGRSGDDEINVRGNAVDRVNCGSGDDVVRAGANDRVKKCEVVLR